MKLAIAIMITVAVNWDKKLKTTHQELDSRARGIISRRFCAPIAVRGVQCAVLYQHRVPGDGLQTTFSPVYFVLTALTHLLIFCYIIAVLLTNIKGQQYEFSLVERNLILLRGNFSHIISTKIVKNFLCI